MSRVFFIGAGRMAAAIAGGLIKSGSFKAEDLLAFDTAPAAAERFTRETGAHCHTGEIDEPALAGAEAVILAVKPQMLADALTGLKSIMESKLVISIAAGISLSQLYDLTDSPRIVRVMTNTPALIGRGCSVAAHTAEVTAAERELVARIFTAIGSYAVQNERMLDAVTGLSGSGPAFVFEFIMALADGGVAEGLSRELALELAARTVAGAAAMVFEAGTHPALLRDQVASPAGTTIRGLEHLAASNFRAAAIGAVREAAKRSRELGGAQG
jgi:pyrroline-5-carboxylate reductase